MRPHGENPPQNVVAIIPARYASTRLPGKMLADVGGKPLIVMTAEKAAAARTVTRVIVATDDERIAEAVKFAGFEAVMTSPEHRSGSDRIAEVARNLPNDPLIVNLQGDEPMIAPTVIDAAVEGLGMADIATTSEKFYSAEDIVSPDNVKVVTDEEGQALYFSRSPIPYPREAVQEYGSLSLAIAMVPGLFERFRKHSGLYVYRREFLMRFTASPPGRLEEMEMLEQLRALEFGALIRVIEVAERSVGIDTPSDLEKLRQMLGAKYIT